MEETIVHYGPQYPRGIQGNGIPADGNYGLLYSVNKEDICGYHVFLFQYRYKPLHMQTIIVPKVDR